MELGSERTSHLDNKIEPNTDEGFQRMPEKFVTLNVEKMIQEGVELTRQSLDFMLGCIAKNDALIHLAEVSVDGDTGETVYRSALMLTTDGGNTLYDVGGVCFSQPQGDAGCRVNWGRSAAKPDNIIDCFQKIKESSNS